MSSRTPGRALVLACAAILLLFSDPPRRLGAGDCGSFVPIAESLGPRMAAGPERRRGRSVQGEGIKDAGASDRLASEALELSRSWRATDKRIAIDRFRDLLELAFQRRNLALEQLAAVRLGDLHRSLGLNREALAYYHQVVHGPRRYPGFQVQALVGIARVRARLEDFQGGREAAREALSRSRELGDVRLEGAARVALGVVHYEAGELDSAVTTLEPSLSLLEGAGENGLFAEAILHLGHAQSDLSREWEAMERMERAARVARESGERGLEAQALVGLGHALSKVGEKQRALDSYQRAATIVEEAGDPYALMSLYSGMGYLHDELGDPDGAAVFYGRALDISDRVGLHIGRIANRVHLGRLRASKGEHEEALSHLLEARALLENVEDRRLEPAVLGQIANLHAARGEEATAVHELRRAIAIARENGFEREEADLLNDLGAVEMRMDRPAEAANDLRRALALSRRTSSPFAESRALYHLARLARDEGRLDEAIEMAEEALLRIESLRNSIDSRSLRVSYVASVYEIHALNVDLLVELERARPGEGWLERAFVGAERARSRALLETLVRTDDEGFVAHDPALVDYESRLEERIRVEAERGNRRCDGETGSAGANVQALFAELDRVRARLGHPGSAKPPEPLEPVGLFELREELLDDRTAFLSYFLGERESYLWAASRARTSFHVLPPRRVVERDARRVYALLAGRDRRTGETEKERHARIRRADAEYFEAAAGLSEMLLGEALRGLDVERLVVVADGALNGIPFSALPRPDVDEAEPSPLVTRYEVVRLPSATIWKALARRRRDREHAVRTVAVLADPVLDVHDPRLAFRPAHGSPHRPFPVFRGAPPERAELPRLLSTRDEARRILELVPEDDRFEALGFDANLGLARSGLLASYDVVHFATHGILNPEHPELSGIVLSLFDRDGNPAKGFLRLYDIYDLRLPVRLVVLSACSTGLGEEVRGEGLVGLVAGFLSSGTQGVIASYWDVDDAATAELMSRFYRNLLVEGLSPSKSLQMAQSSMWNEKRWFSPELWSAFEFQGLGE